MRNPIPYVEISLAQHVDLAYLIKMKLLGLVVSGAQSFRSSASEWEVSRRKLILLMIKDRAFKSI